jgi:ABC-2 type transport system ATP-binding protein
MTEAWAIEAHDLVKTFDTNRAVDGVELLVETGSVYGVLGPNGAGKTTTIRMLATLLEADSGTATIFGHNVFTEPQAVRQLIGLTGQSATVDETLSAVENLMIFSKLLGLSTSAAKRKTAELLEEFSLTDAAKRPLKNFSGGMRRRLDLAASLIAQPPLIFLDEPTTGLDPRTRAQMWDTIRRLVRDGSTIVLTTQTLDEADQLSQRVAVIDHGKVVAEGTPDELKASVGVSTLILKVADAASANGAAGTTPGQGTLDKTQRVVTEVLGDVAVVVGADGRVTAPMQDPEKITDLLIRLRDAKIHLAEVSVQKPTLDEVFLAITGHTAEEPETDEEEAA